MTVSRRVLLMIGSAFGLVQCSAPHGVGPMPPPLKARSARTPVSGATRAILQQTRHNPIDRPQGQSTEVSSGRFAYRGKASFKLPYRVMTGAATTLEWEKNKIFVTAKKGQSFSYRVDESNSQISLLDVSGS